MDLPRGMKDFENMEIQKIEYIRQHFIETANTFGFDLMEPSPIELMSVIEAKSGPTIRDDVYFFNDKGDREVSLRFDFTIGLTRYATEQKSMKLPAKISSFGGVWRYDEPQKGRYRFFHQWDIEIFGKPMIQWVIECININANYIFLVQKEHQEKYNLSSLLNILKP
ncbi:MAG: ATP phosphoribosyltransferase regulatory subunit, partial [Thermoproteota archaeon]|nr:ATP phosphoribosyltransferase regulatory subunit [Thermoproteota archaeon]